MSFIIDHLDLFIQRQILLKTQQTAINNTNRSENGQGNNINYKTIQKSLGTLKDSLINIQSTNLRTELNFILNKVHRNLNFLLTVKVIKNNNQIHLLFRPLIFNQTFMKVTSAERRIYGCKTISIFNKIKPKIFNQFKISIEPNNGLIKIQPCSFYKLQHKEQNLPHIIHFFIKIFLINLKDLYEPLLKIIEITNQNPKCYLPDLYIKNKNTRLVQIQKFVKLLNVDINVGAEETNQFHYFNKKLLNELLSIQAVNQNITKLSEDFKSNSIYCIEKQNLSIHASKHQNKKQLSLDEKDRKEIIQNLQIPQITTMISNNERCYVVNFIKLIKQINQQRCLNIATGGFADIYVAQIQFHLVSSDNSARQDLYSGILLQRAKKKTIVIKRDNKNALNNDKSRIDHQKKILVLMKNAFAAFVPKYYFVKTQSQHFQRDLMMQYVHMQQETLNLEQFMNKYSSFTSQHTKIFLAYQLINGLRFLKDYQITHLDLKLSNIMLGKKLDIKIIDFGQSYHPSIGNHQPGLSMPFSAPQNYTSENSFNYKNDVYSFGVILHKLLSSKYPFYIYSQKQRQYVYSNQMISERWYFAPQGFTQYGQNSLLPIIQLLIGKCLHPNPKHRPQLEWISLILRQYLFFH